MCNSHNKVTTKRATFTKTEREYVKGIVQNLSLQRLTDREIVHYLKEEKKIDLNRTTVTKMRIHVEKEAEKWYLELRQSNYKSIAFYKERIDSLFSYQKKLNQIIEFYMDPPRQILYSDTIIRAIAELHRIEMSLHTIFQQFPHEQWQINLDYEKKNGPRQCNCLKKHKITHSQCRSCLQVWCPDTLGQEWCPNPDCSSGIKGSTFKPYDSEFEWVQCSTCKMWFMTHDIMAVHNCVIVVNRQPNNIVSTAWAEESEEIEMQDTQESESVSIATPEVQDSNPVVVTSTGNDPVIEEQPQEKKSEADIYWSTHGKPKHRDNQNKPKFVTR